MPQTFNFPYHATQDEYPESSIQIRFGRGHQFATQPMGPDQYTFRLSFQAMFYYFDASRVLTSTVEPTLNYKAFQEFYETHLLYEKFIYPHPVRGNVSCRFLKPPVTPKGVKDQVGLASDGVTRRHLLEPFDIQLISQP